MESAISRTTNVFPVPGAPNAIIRASSCTQLFISQRMGWGFLQNSETGRIHRFVPSSSARRSFPAAA